MILGLFTELMTPGGIQQVGRHIAAVLASFARDRGFRCRLLSLNDPPGYHGMKIADIAFTIQGFGRRRNHFVLALLTTVLRVRLAYIGHPHLAPLGLLLRLLQPKIHYWVATHGIEVWEPLPLIHRLGLRSAYVVTAPSHFTREKATAAQKLKPGKVTVLPWALDPELLKKDETLVRLKSLTSLGKVLLTVGRLTADSRYKGMDAVIRALPRVLKVIPDTCYVIVGDGDDRPRLECLAQDRGVASHVHFIGIVGDELSLYYDACDIFVMPSRGEGFGLVFLEAMACGKPVIAGSQGASPEVVVDGVTGFLVDNSDIGTLADRLIRLLSDEELRKRMGEIGRRRVEENYTFERFHQRLTQLMAVKNAH